MHVSLRKLSEAPNARCKSALWREFTPGAEGDGRESLPVAYELEGELLAPITLGCPMRIFRTKRNGVEVDGMFTSSPVQAMDAGWVRTENSLYRVRAIVPPVGATTFNEDER